MPVMTRNMHRQKEKRKGRRRRSNSSSSSDVLGVETDLASIVLDDDPLDQNPQLLLRFPKIRLLKLCMERNLDVEGKTKPELVESLMQWKTLQDRPKRTAAIKAEARLLRNTQLQKPLHNIAKDGKANLGGIDLELRRRQQAKRVEVVIERQSLGFNKNKKESRNTRVEDEEEEIIEGEKENEINHVVEPNEKREKEKDKGRRRERREKERDKKEKQYKPTKDLERDSRVPVPPSPSQTTTLSAPNDQRVPDLDALDLADFRIPFDAIVKGPKIGSGAFKDVYSGTFQGTPVAIGELRISNLTDHDIKELEVLRMLRHDNIVRFIGVATPSFDPLSTRIPPICIITELADGDLFDWIRQKDPPEFDKMLELIYDIASGVNYLHTRRPAIIHRDLKSINILIKENHAKINDFGLARIKHTRASVMHSIVGTANWQAPEFWTASPVYNEKVDVYSCALIFWEILTWIWPERRYPFEGLNNFQIYENVGRKKQRPPTVGLRKNYPHALISLVEQMWDHNPAARPSMAKVVEELQQFLP
ncbi:uncharacterized protein VTP21DRAFT_3537 [Calcarisporiella thermophila]|uniref:uncharacterized protein n=1 Tax=Calcarisporiella thermophila TaxID=911321 RepID=UPI0037449E3B